MSTTLRRHGWRPADQAMALLFRLALADDWCPERAAVEWSTRVDDRRVFEQVGARIQRALADRHSDLGARAAQTVALVLAGPHPGDAAWA